MQHQLIYVSIQVTRDRYGHLMPEVNDLALPRLGSRFWLCLVKRLQMQQPVFQSL